MYRLFWCSFSSVGVNLLLMLLYYMYVHLDTIKCELWHTVYRLSSGSLISYCLCFNLINNFWEIRELIQKHVCSAASGAFCVLSLSLSEEPSSHQLQSRHLGWWIQQKHYVCRSMFFGTFPSFHGVFVSWFLDPWFTILRVILWDRSTLLCSLLLWNGQMVFQLFIRQTNFWGNLSLSRSIALHSYLVLKVQNYQKLGLFNFSCWVLL